MLHSKYHLLDVNASAAEHSGVNLLAAASTYGIIILASPTSASFQGKPMVHRLHSIIFSINIFVFLDSDTIAPCHRSQGRSNCSEANDSITGAGSYYSSELRSLDAGC